jgi:hypothetical protein
MTTKKIVKRAEIARMIIERVNAAAPEKIEGIDIVPVHRPIANWGPGVYWPPAVAKGMTETILLEVVADLQREYDIAD